MHKEETMYRIEVEETAEFLRFKVYGSLTWDTDNRIDADVANECERSRATAAIIDISSMQGRLTTLENHEAAKTLAERLQPRLSRIAIVDTSEHREQNEMYEVTAQNRGG